MYIKNSKDTGRRYIVISIKDSINSANKPVVRGLFSILKAF
jgi:hypothetical protein